MFEISSYGASADMLGDKCMSFKIIAIEVEFSPSIKIKFSTEPKNEPLYSTVRTGLAIEFERKE